MTEWTPWSYTYQVGTTIWDAEKRHFRQRQILEDNYGSGTECPAMEEHETISGYPCDTFADGLFIPTAISAFDKARVAAKGRDSCLVRTVRLTWLHCIWFYRSTSAKAELDII